MATKMASKIVLSLSGFFFLHSSSFLKSIKDPCANTELLLLLCCTLVHCYFFLFQQLPQFEVSYLAATEKAAQDLTGILYYPEDKQKAVKGAISQTVPRVCPVLTVDILNRLRYLMSWFIIDEHCTIRRKWGACQRQAR